MTYDYEDLRTLWQINITENYCYLKSFQGIICIALEFRTNDIIDSEGDPGFNRDSGEDRLKNKADAYTPNSLISPQQYQNSHVLFSIHCK